MFTGPRGKIFISYRWSGDDFDKIALFTAHQLVSRGYEVVFDKWTTESHKIMVNESFVSVLIREMASCNIFLALISEGYLDVFARSPTRPSPSDSVHRVRNDGVVRDELNLANLNLHGPLGPIEGVGLAFGCDFRGSYEFAFPIHNAGSSSRELCAILDRLFGRILDLPAWVDIEVKFAGKWRRWPTRASLPLAYSIARRMILDHIVVKHDYYHHREHLQLWSRIDRKHVVYERRAMRDPDPTIKDQDIVYVCDNCTATYEAGMQEEDRASCVRCRRGKCYPKLRSKVEALVVLRPLD